MSERESGGWPLSGHTDGELWDSGRERKRTSHAIPSKGLAVSVTG